MDGNLSKTVEGALSIKLMHKCKMQRCMVSEVKDMVLPHKYGNAQPNKSAMHTLYVSGAYLVLTALVLALMSIECKAASTSLSDEISLAEVLKLYEYKLLDMRMSIMSFCQTMMFYLGAISLVIEGSKAILRHADYFYIFIAMIRIILTFGAIYFLIFNGYEFASDVINSLIQLGAGDEHRGNLEGMLQLIESFFTLADNYAKQMAGKSKVYYYVFLTVMFVLLVAFILRYVTLYVWSMLLCVAGMILIPFGALASTRGLAISYFRAVLATGIALMTLTIIYIIGIDVIRLLTIRINNYIASGGTIHLQDAGYIVMVMLFVVSMGFKLPSMMSSLVSVSSFNYFTRLSLRPNNHIV